MTRQVVTDEAKVTCRPCTLTTSQRRTSAGASILMVSCSEFLTQKGIEQFHPRELADEPSARVTIVMYTLSLLFPGLFQVWLSLIR